MRRAVVCLLFAACSDDAVPELGVVCGDGTRDEFENCDDGNHVSGDGCDDFCQPEPLVTVTWAFFPSLGAPEQPGCRAGVGTIELVTEVNTAMRYPCDDKRTGTIFVPLGKRVFARLRDGADEIIAESLPAQPPSTWRIDAPFYEDAGYIRASFARPACGTSMALSLDGGMPLPTQTVSCSTALGFVVSQPILAGTYDLRFTNPAGDVYTQAGVVVGSNNRITDLAFR